VVCALIKLLCTLTSCCYWLKGKTHLNEVYYSPRHECIVEDRKGKSDIKRSWKNITWITTLALTVPSGDFHPSHYDDVGWNHKLFSLVQKSSQQTRAGSVKRSACDPSSRCRIIILLNVFTFLLHAASSL